MVFMFLFLNITYPLKSYAEYHNAFRNSFPDSVVPNKSTVQRLECSRETRGSGEKRRSGRPSVLSNDSVFVCNKLL
jgi:hypothetical protein